MKKPNEFYFQFCPGDDENVEDGVSEDPYFLITGIKYYDRHKHLDDNCGQHNTPVPKDFYELTEATFEYDGDPQVGRQLLSELGFVEKKLFVN